LKRLNFFTFPVNNKKIPTTDKARKHFENATLSGGRPELNKLTLITPTVPLKRAANRANTEPPICNLLFVLCIYHNF